MMISEREAITLTDTVTGFGEHAQWTGVRASEREEWLAFRRTMVTASEMACILGESPFGDALKVFVDKTTAAIAQPDPGIYSPLFWGGVLEQPILTNAAKYFGWDYREGGALLRSRHFPFLGCTLDAEIDRHDGRGLIVNEGKTSQISKQWDEEAGTLPGHILVQAQHQLLCTGAPCCLVFALLQGCRPCQIEVFPSVEYHAALIEHAEQFMARVKNLDAPAPTYLSGPTLERMFPVSDGSTVMLPEIAVDWTTELGQLAADLAKLAKRKEELRNMIRKAIGNCTFGQLPTPVNGKSYWRWLESHREGYVVEARDEWSLLSLKGATMPGEKSGVRSVSVEETEGSDDLQEGQQVVRLKKRRR